MRSTAINVLVRRCNDTVRQPGRIAGLSRRCYASNAKPELTSIRYKVRRGPYASISTADVRFFDGLLDSNRIITDPEECESYNIDFPKTVRGSSQLVLKPKTTEEVSAILKYCNEKRLAVCPQSGNTGLVGGSTPVFDEIVISMKLMNKILETNHLAGLVTCEAGCVLQDLEEHLATVGLMMPLDLGAKGSCLIGGCVSTNAGGLRLLRYGNLHGNVLGVEAVKANGDVVDAMNNLKKNNTGYHVKHLFIGSEGTLGIVTKVAIQCPPLPKAVNVAFLGLTSFDKVLEIYHLARKELGEILSSCEMMDRISLDVPISNLGMKNPLTSEKGHDFYMIIETSGSHLAHDEEKLSLFVEKAMDQGIIEDGTLTNETTKVQYIWSLRERISEGVLHDGYVFKYDISLPFSSYYEVVEVLRKRLRDPRIIRISGYGHIGDSNIHVQVSIPEYYEDVAAQLEPFIFEYISGHKGSVSAEHGIGFKKSKYLHLSRNPSEIEMMHDLKKLMDPNGILNPYKVLQPITATA
ncbi:PREDICTED: D-2-hydroxyglutarate dehydrogenase, mitochondrial [Dinoponera quadriceps]|uniref:D-2-hydroxyglutarate dehydrogenase, mitochondrial n=1 Tax=Dinoponera quadriceps TaxID=609295 RepID=A0A6P3XRD4_DINQU|nr:PREDICTED: D-2-hydroxyglutarate dehydrogenase, mitochondrial [Dinoponera quadriceps]XP_014480950.1 PREDICTED: D-2-hydroxyglutarate dehydrogenase, mitochondrial [Dinoponera quadriceps]XP_014480951.1 PREDICTED: D-2-hydroxyglutarate dehydrogenase, mitochondrial [Dinoponera quadriceps]XP_014480952.1 PREDICTED: D-2-hydroxyglutarate dehydrogenase, mitochondrial [Dinoponera quadriceps]